MKKFLAIVFIICILTVNSYAYGQTSEGIVVDYLYTDDSRAENILDDEGRKCLTVIGYKGILSKITIPDEIVMDEEGISLPITAISDSAFENNTTIQHITIGNNITSIGKSAFESCTELLSVDLPENLTVISEGTFRNCILLSEIELPDGLTEIGSYAFEGCMMLGELEIPSSVSIIGHDAFFCCEKLVLNTENNDYAEEYAKQNNLFTSSDLSPDYAVKKAVYITVAAVSVMLIAYIFFKTTKNRKGNKSK